MSRRQTLIEFALIFAVFFLQGAWPVPEVNEPYYLGKAIHFWNPDWVTHDFFLDTADTHAVFYFTFGWLARWLPPMALAWSLRVLTWTLLAWAWQRLSRALVSRPWFSALAAALFVFLLQHFTMAGEWVVGGVEAKGFAYVLVLLGLESLVRGRWNLAWLLVGAASAFHVLVGGWSAVAVGLTWGLSQFSGHHASSMVGENGTVPFRGPTSDAQPPSSPLPSARSMAPGIVAGGLLSLLGLIPSLALDWGQDPAVVRRSHIIYVYERLRHHLDPFLLPPQGDALRDALQFYAERILPFVLLCVVWFLLRRTVSGDAGTRRLRSFVAASLAIALAGVGIRMLIFYDEGLAAGLLRFYWFRLSDVAVPLGVALMATRWAAGLESSRHTPCAVRKSEQGRSGPRADHADVVPGARYPGRRVTLAALIVLATFHLGDCVVLRLFAAPPAAERVPDPAAWRSALRWLTGRRDRPIFPRQPHADRLPDYPAWRDACAWVAQSGQIPTGARFIVPRMAQTFRWYAHRGEVANWKEIPQDATNLVLWWQRVEDIYATGNAPPADRWYESPGDLGRGRLLELAAKYGADYAIAMRSRSPVPLPVVYRNKSYVIYELR